MLQILRKVTAVNRIHTSITVSRQFYSSSDFRRNSPSPHDYLRKITDTDKNISKQRIKTALELFKQKGFINTDAVTSLLGLCNSKLSNATVADRHALIDNIWSTSNDLGVRMNTSTYNAYLQAILNNALPCDHNVVLQSMSAADVEPDGNTYILLVDLFCKKGDVDKALKLIEYMKGKDMELSKDIFHSLLYAYSKEKNHTAIEEVLNSLTSTSFNISFNTYYAMIIPAAERGDVNQVMEYLDRMKTKSHLTPFYRYVLKIFSTFVSNGHLEEGIRFLDASPIDIHSKFAPVFKNTVSDLVLNGHIEGARALYNKFESVIDKEFVMQGHYVPNSLTSITDDVDAVLKECEYFKGDTIRHPIINSVAFAIQNNKQALAFQLLKASRSEIEPRYNFFIPFLINKHLFTDFEKEVVRYAHECGALNGYLLRLIFDNLREFRPFDTKDYFKELFPDLEIEKVLIDSVAIASYISSQQFNQAIKLVKNSEELMANTIIPSLVDVVQRSHIDYDAVAATMSEIQQTNTLLTDNDVTGSTLSKLFYLLEHEKNEDSANPKYVSFMESLRQHNCEIRNFHNAINIFRFLNFSYFVQAAELVSSDLFASSDIEFCSTKTALNLINDPGFRSKVEEFCQTAPYNCSAKLALCNAAKGDFAPAIEILSSSRNTSGFRFALQLLASAHGNVDLFTTQLSHFKPPVFLLANAYLNRGEVSKAIESLNSDAISKEKLSDFFNSLLTKNLYDEYEQLLLQIAQVPKFQGEFCDTIALPIVQHFCETGNEERALAVCKALMKNNNCIVSLFPVVYNFFKSKNREDLQSFIDDYFQLKSNYPRDMINFSITLQVAFAALRNNNYEKAKQLMDFQESFYPQDFNRVMIKKMAQYLIKNEEMDVLKEAVLVFNKFSTDPLNEWMQHCVKIDSEEMANEIIAFIRNLPNTQSFHTFVLSTLRQNFPNLAEEIELTGDEDASRLIHFAKTGEFYQAQLLFKKMCNEGAQIDSGVCRSVAEILFKFKHYKEAIEFNRACATKFSRLYKVSEFSNDVVLSIVKDSDKQTHSMFFQFLEDVRRCIKNPEVYRRLRTNHLHACVETNNSGFIKRFISELVGDDHNILIANIPHIVRNASDGLLQNVFVSIHKHLVLSLGEQMACVSFIKNMILNEKIDLLKKIIHKHAPNLKSNEILRDIICRTSFVRFADNPQEDFIKTKANYIKTLYSIFEYPELKHYLLHCYCRLNDVDNAEKLFDSLEEKRNLSKALVTSYCRLLTESNRKIPDFLDIPEIEVAKNQLQ